MADIEQQDLPPCEATFDDWELEFCRWRTAAIAAGTPDFHQCTNAHGDPLQPGQMCHQEARAQAAETPKVTAADIDGLLDSPYPEQADRYGDRWNCPPDPPSGGVDSSGPAHAGQRGTAGAAGPGREDHPITVAEPAGWPASYHAGQYVEDAVCRHCRRPILRRSTSVSWISNGQTRGNDRWGPWTHTTSRQAACRSDSADMADVG